MGDGPAPAPREHGWTGVLLALAAFLLLPLAFRSVLPVAETGLLLLPTLAACFLVGWWGGGRRWLAALWAALTAWEFLRADSPADSSYRDITRGWALMVAGALGVVSFVAPRRPAFPRAAAAVGLAVLLSLMVLLVAGESPSEIRGVFSEEFARRNAEYARAVQTQFRVPLWQDAAARWPTMREVYDQSVVRAYGASQVAAGLYPALLALESLAATVLAWSLYHRLSRARIGPPLRPLREFRFSDQLVWGFVAGLVVVLMPQLEALRPVGANLVLFFGVLYAMRGFGVMTWTIARLPRGGPIVGALAAAGLLLLILAPVLLALGLGLGLMDTWVDWRRRARPTT